MARYRNNSPAEGDTRYAVYSTRYPVQPVPELHAVFDSMRSANNSALRLFDKLVRERVSVVDYRVETEARTEIYTGGEWREK